MLASSYRDETLNFGSHVSDYECFRGTGNSKSSLGTWTRELLCGQLLEALWSRTDCLHVCSCGLGMSDD